MRPLQDGTPVGGFTKFAYNDGDGSTGYDRHFAILLNELWRNFHDGDRDIQESIATDYDPQWFTLNGRVYPQTVLPNDSRALPARSRIGTPNPNYDDAIDDSQPNSALVQVNPGERVLLRLANLGYQQHAMRAARHPDARRRAGRLAAAQRGGGDTSYWTSTCTSGPARRATCCSTHRPTTRAAVRLGRAAAATTSTASRTGTGAGSPTSAPPGPGGMMTEVRVYQAALPAQTVVSQTYV